MIPTIHQYSIVVVLLLFNFNSLAQDTELFKIQSTYYPSQAVEASSIDGAIGFWEWSGHLAIPQVFKSKGMLLIHKLGYRNLRVVMEGNFTNAVAEVNKHYHSVFYNLTWVKILNPKWRLLVNVMPTLASDFTESLSDRDFLFQASAMAILAKSEKIKYGFGLAYTTRFGRQIIMPTAMLNYTRPKMTVDVLLPSKLSILFNTHKHFHFGLEATLDGGLFNNNGEVPIVNTLIDEAGYSRLNLGPTLVFQLKDAIRIHLTGGMAVGRRLDLIDGTEEVLDRTPEDGPFFRVGFSFRPQGKRGE
ncbi:MAG: DUF6268 family outer membrane beta-barrel protein [Bacteroidota bacterium]